MEDETLDSCMLIFLIKAYHPSISFQKLHPSRPIIIYLREVSDLSLLLAADLRLNGGQLLFQVIADGLEISVFRELRMLAIGDAAGLLGGRMDGSAVLVALEEVRHLFAASLESADGLLQLGLAVVRDGSGKNGKVQEVVGGSLEGSSLFGLSGTDGLADETERMENVEKGGDVLLGHGEAGFQQVVGGGLVSTAEFQRLFFDFLHRTIGEVGAETMA